MEPDLQSLIAPVKRRLRTIWGRWVWARFVQDAIVAMGVLSAVLLCLLAAEAVFWVHSPWRTALFVLWLAAAAGLVGVLILPPVMVGWRRRSRFRHIARCIANEVPEADDQLVNLLELGRGDASAAPPGIVMQAVQRLHDDVVRLPLERAVNFRRSLQIARLAVVPAAGLLVFLLAAPQAFLGASHRLFSPGVSFQRPVSFTVEVEPGSVRVTRGESLTISARLSGQPVPEAIALEIHPSGQRRARSVVLRPEGTQRFVHQQSNVRQEFRYRVVASPLVSPWYEVTVLDRPVLRNLSVDLIPPAYTGLPRQSLTPGTGNITALVGTRAEISVRSSITPVAARLTFESDRPDVPMPELKGTFVVQQKDHYRIDLVSPEGIASSDPVRYSVTPVSDRYPSVRIVAPEPEAILDVSLNVPLAARLDDDYGFTRVALFWRLAESRFDETMDEFESFDLAVPLDRALVYTWPINATTGLDVIPGDEVAYYLRVWDNDNLSGPKAASSAIHRIRLPSLTEHYDQLGELQDNTEADLESLLEYAAGLREQFDELSEELRRKQDADWDDQRQLEDLTEAQQSMQSQVEALSEAMDQAAEQMEDHGLISDELLSMFEELREVTDEINDPALMEALRQLQEALEELDPQKLQSSLEDFAFSEEQFQERLERTLELFRNFQVQQKLDEAASRAEDLKEIQENLAEQTAQDPDSVQAEPLGRRQRQASEDMEALEEQMADISERMDEMRSAPQEEMDRLNEETRARQLPEAMMENARQMLQNQMQQANQGQQQMSRSMQQLQGQLQQMQQNMQSQQMGMNLTGLSQVLSNVLLLSHDQEALRQRVVRTTPNSTRLREYARQQAQLGDGARLVIDSLQSLGRTLPQLTRDALQYAGSALLSMDAATDALVERDSRQAEDTGRNAMTHLNELALLLSDLMAQMQSSAASSSGGGMSMEQMIEQLQQMAAQQRDLNRALDDLLGQMEGERLSVDMQERLQQLAGQQEQMRRQLEQLSRERDLARRLAGDLDQIAAQMEESIRELTLPQTRHPEVRERQQQILTRLLDASRSMTERGQQRRREGEQAEETGRAGPDLLNLVPSEEALQRALLEALESGYAREYQALIRRYFELLEQQ
ncbi:MAG: chromosome partitioning protein ParA [Bacteroidota bacterium]|nr:chromosome partitioning protein ParA [Bacteroidota bacterium]